MREQISGCCRDKTKETRPWWRSGFLCSVCLTGAVGAFAAGVEELANGADKASGVVRRGDSAGEDGLVGNIAATVIGARVFLVLVDDVSSEVDASEDALAA